ncbi:MAG TPA: PilT/PilU family type 4a pilus ATPase [Acidimicrobiales bacterium]|nr:PilT/PilU family type 4a pilus ATPase [Acidimicrobiales bacterium]
MTRDVMEAALEEASRSGQPFPQVIAAHADIPPTDLAAAWAAALGARHIDFDTVVVEPEAVALLPEELGRSSRAVPVSVAGRTLLVAFSTPLDPRAVKQVTDHVRSEGGDIEIGLSDDGAIGAALDAAYGATSAAPDTTVGHAEPSHELYRIFDRALELGASDVHLAANQPPFIRVVGELVRMPDEPVLSAAKVRELAFSILSVRQQQKFEETSELDTSHAMGNRVRFRVNVFVQRNAVGVAFRVIPFEVIDFDQLGLPPTVRTFANYPRGLILVTGPTGSGKSTTLASLIDIVNRERQSHIITIEDPIEFVHNSKVALVNQREVGTDTAGFGAALTSAMRQDPDVILVGEMRDLETISTAITAAETGHLVYATLHTQDAAQTVDRIIDVFPAEQQAQVRIQLANSLVGVVTQQLVPTADGRARAVASEVMVANHAIRALIRDGKVHQIHNAMMSGRKLGMQSMDDSLADLVRRGLVTLEQAQRRAQNPDELSRLIGAPQP